MKKKFTFLFTALFAVTSLWAQEFQSGDLKYYLDDGSNVMVTKGEYEGLTKVVIPETVEYEGVSYAVTGIWSGTFANCEKLVSITIPNSVKNIGCEAFSGCSSLASITIPNSIKNIEYALFADCSSLTSITIPESVINIEETAFARCSSLESIKVESGNIIYDSRENCNAIIETASNSLICGCKNTTIPNNVISIASGAFEDCSGLASIAIPNGVASIKGSAFRGCTSLTSIHISCSVTDIANMAFMDCPAIELITVEEGNNVYDSRDNCNAIIKKENSFSSILELGCKNTVIPYNTTQIAGYAFFGCSGLKSITIPNSVTYIGGRAFGGCSGLTSITIPAYVGGIGEDAFFGCSGLTSIILKAKEPPYIIGQRGVGLSSEIPIYVPKESVEAYKIAECWKDLNIIGYDETGIADITIDNEDKTAYKMLRDGKLIIRKADKTYNLKGAEMK